MSDSLLTRSLTELGEQFSRRNWKYLDVPAGAPMEKSYAWPASPDEDIMVCVHKGRELHESFHRQEFFFFNFAYKGDYGALSYRSNNPITVYENEYYIGQPFTGYALRVHSLEEVIIVGILIRKEAFFRTFLPVLSSDHRLFHFFLAPQTNEYSDQYIHLHFNAPSNVRTLLEMMVEEYAFPQEDTQAVLQPLVLTLLMQVARQYKHSVPAPENETLSDRIIRYMNEHPGTVTLKDIAKHFSYHPNYISGLLHRQTGKTYSELLLAQRMERAVSLLKGSTLSVEEVAAMVGYTNNSNFYKAFREYYHQSPRQYISKRDPDRISF